MHNDEEWDHKISEMLNKANDIDETNHQSLSKNGLSEDVQTSILKRGKRKNRITIILLSLTTLIVVALLVVAFPFSNSIFINHLFKPDTQDALRVTSDLIQFTKPGVTASISSEKNNFTSWDFTFNLKEQLGLKEQTVGTFKNEFTFSKLNGHLKWANGQHETPFYFRFPGATFSEGTGDSLNPNGWGTLEKLPEGTVAQLAISLSRSMTLDEYFNLIKKYDLKTSWLAIDTGIEKDLSSKNQFLGSGLVFGYAPNALNYGSNDNPGNDTIQENGEGERRSQTYMNELLFLINHKKWTDSLLSIVQTEPQTQKVSLEQRYEYLKKNGVKMYGAILTGPTKELLKLKENKDFNTPFVGSIGWWNWDQQSATGVEFDS
ncbi:anti-sigma factor [Paenibacillus sp. OAE614]|uniref:anti-sigma factor n=1 Tax=Paenibacillus sp. OAE614 TaxID=2663804 RepID=UPI00178AA2E6